MSNLPRLRLRHDQRGVMLLTILIVSVILTGIGLSIAQLVISQYDRTNKNVYRANAILVAEAGIERTMQQINANVFTGFPTAQTHFDNSTQGYGVYTSSIANGSSGNEKIITSVGKVYRPSDHSNPISTRKIKVTVVGTSSSGYSVQAGVGGLILGGSANIVNSDIYVAGTIKMTGASKIGTQSQPVPVKVAYQSCPGGSSPGASYPATCTSGQPIAMDYSTAIYGSVCATNQTNSKPGGNPNGNILPGNGGTGLQLGCVPPAVSQPTYDRATHIGAMSATACRTTAPPSTTACTGTSTNNTITCQSWPFVRTWPANLKITGNVTVSSSCDVTLKGNVYITGDLTVDGAAKIKVDNSLGATRPVIVVDGKINMNGSGGLMANNVGTGIHFITFKSAVACTIAASPCTTLSGNDLYNSKNIETISIGGAVNLPGMVFQAYWGKLTVGGSGNIGSALGQTIDMSGAGTITFGTILSSGDRTWTIRSYQQDFSP